MENNYIKNDNNRVENPCMTQGEGKKRVRRGREEGKRWIGWRMLRVAVVLGVMMGWGVSEVWGATVTYHIINLGKLDNNGQLTSTRTEALQFTITSTSLIVGLPEEYKSPLAKNWQYYSSDDVTYNTSTKVCVFNTGPSLSVGDALSDGDHVYVTYEFDEEALSTVGLFDGSICKIKFNLTNQYLQQTVWQGAPNTGSYALQEDPSFYWKVNIKDPYQITIQSQSTTYPDYYLSADAGKFADIRLKTPLSTAITNKVWVFGLLPDAPTNTYRLIVTDGYTYHPNQDGIDQFGHGYLNNNDIKDGVRKTRYQKYSGSSYSKCALTFVPLTKTYIIVNNLGETLVQATTTDYPLEVPDVIKSPFATYSYYSDAACTHEISAVGNTTTIYVRYTTTSSSLNLNGGTEYYVCTNNNYWYAANATTIGIANSFADPTSETKWTINGNDAYQLTIKNVGNNKEVTYDVSSGEAVPTLSDTGSKFFLHQSNTGRYEVVAVTSGDYTSSYYSMGVANSTLKLYSNINYPLGQDEVQSVFLTQMACSTPVIAFDYTTGQVTISTATSGATIHYTTDGTEPTTSSQSYSNPFTINSTTTIKAIAVKTGFDNSEMAERTFEQVAQPTIQNNGNNAISINCATEGATIYYTPNVSGTPNIVYTGPLTEGFSGVTIRAIAIKENMVPSAECSGTVILQCATPVITRVGMTFTLSCSMPANAHLYYRINSGSETEYTDPVSFNTGQLPMTVTAVARHDDYTDSETATLQLINGQGTPEDPYLIYSDTDFANFVTNVNNGTTASSYYKLGIDVSASGSDAITTTFTGSFDGDSHTISNLSNPLFNTVDGGVVKSVTLKFVNISSSADTIGAIACVAKGYTRIYNCGILPNDNTFPEGEHPSVSTTGKCAGGLVGSLRDDSRVINCYSYADVTAAKTAAGIVGRNTFASTAAVTSDKYTKLRTAIVNCMFYGNILGGTSQCGVYGGTLITNAAADGINSYNYYSNGSTFNTPSNNTYGAGEPTSYNCSFPAEVRYLTQVEFHRSLLNSNRELCGWWVGSDVAPSTLTTAEVQAIPKDASLMYKWVLDPNIAPYPILKPFGKYPSVVNPFTGTPWFDHVEAAPYQGKQLGTLKVIVKSGSRSSAENQTLYLPITDMDTLHYDYCYRKVQLPYFNTVFGKPNGTTWAQKYAGNYTENVVTGWKITAVTTNGTIETYNSFVPHWENGYNFADRKCTEKDLYSVSGRVFAQGGNYYVPDGVTEITIEAYWGKAIYVRNAGDSYDRVNITAGNTENTGAHFAPAGTRSNNVNSATIQSTSKLSDALNNTTIPTQATVYDYALVLVGNVQESVGKKDFIHSEVATRGFTIMSVDLDFDEEPDYCLEWQLGLSMVRQMIAPIRFDFLPIIELGIAGKLSGSKYFLSLGCYRSKGHFEVTETAFIRFGQFEFELGEREEGPVILNGGIYDQYCRGRNGEENQHINYVLLGGHVLMPSFTPGAHVNTSARYQTRHCAVNALGGDFTSFYLTGGYNERIKPFDDNPHCYIDGGHFGTIAAAYKEGIAGNVTWRINHALIGEFYGGGVMSQATGDYYKIVKGNIDVVIDNSIVGKYCGGPKFGDMVEGKTVTTSATNTIFTHYYGAGNGGTNYTQYNSTDATGAPISDWSNTINSNYHVGQYRSADQSYEANYDIEVINTSTGNQENYVVNRSYYYSAQFATTNTGNVTSTLTDCIVKTNFYGAGFLGGVRGNVTSTLTGTHVMGSVYGAGFSASAGTVTIYNKDKTPPKPNVFTGMIKPQVEGTSKTYYWSNNHGSTGSPATAASPATHDTAYFYTEIPLENLGAVSNNVTLVITGNSTIGTVEGGNLVENTGNVFGGGDQSAVTGNTSVYLQDNTQVLGNVYGGGNNGSVNGDSEVVIQDIPVICGTTPFTASTTVIIIGPSGASIYYTTDGNTPTASSTLYDGAFTLTATTTVKAIAITNGVISPVATKTFTKQ